MALLGIAFDNLTLGETVNRIDAMIHSGRSHYVATANVDFLAVARRDSELRSILLNAPLVLCDGTPLVWASRVFGNALPERVAGADVVPELIRLAAEKNYRLFFLGTSDDANKRAIAKLREQYPNLLVTYYSPPFRSIHEMDNEEIIRRIRAAKPHLLLVAFGCPKAEKWMAMHHEEIKVPVSIGVGATIDFLAGGVKRAPLWMQRGGVEWIYRLGQEPRRLFKRYATDLCFFGGAIIQQCWSMKRRKRSRPSRRCTCTVQFNTTWQRVEAALSLTKDSVERDSAQWQELGDANRHVLLELAETETVDSTGLAVLVHLKKQLQVSGRQLVLLSPSPVVWRALRSMRLENFFRVASDALQARALVNGERRDSGLPQLSQQPV